MRKRMYIALLATLALACACASKPKPFLWKIEKSGQASYVFGVLHSGAGPADVPELARERLNSCSAFVTELDVKPEQGRDPRAALELGASSPNLDQMISLAAWAALNDRLKNFPVDRLKRMNPFFAIYLIEESEKRERASEATAKDAAPKKTAALALPHAASASASSSGNVSGNASGKNDGAVTMDEYMIEAARSKGLVISYLEEKTDALRTCVDRAIAHELEGKLIKVPGKNDDGAEMSRVVAAYRSGELSQIATLEADEEKETAAKGECSIGARNRDWAQKIERYDSVYAPAFFSVGVGHLATKEGSLLDLLQEQGFKVERLSR